MANLKCSVRRCRAEADLIVLGKAYCDKHNRERLEDG
jgi:hypothetical protein